MPAPQIDVGAWAKGLRRDRDQPSLLAPSMPSSDQLQHGPATVMEVVVFLRRTLIYMILIRMESNEV